MYLLVKAYYNFQFLQPMRSIKVNFLKQNTVVYLVFTPCNTLHIEPAGGTVFTGVSIG